jgi:HemY protein
VLAPTTPWLLRILFDLHCRRGAWADAATTLGALGRAKVLEGAELAQRQATVTLALARQAEAEAAPDTALRHAKAAVQAAPSFVPAVTALARLETSHGKPARALAAIEKLWPTTQHPDLAATYLAAAPGDALDRFRRAEKLAALAPEAAESHLLLGVAALDAKLWGEAKRHFEDALHADPAHPRRALKGLARAEADGFDRREIAHQHRDRASDAADDARWHCTACGMVQPAWSPSCTACGAVDTVTWSTPGTTSRSTALVQLVPDAGDGARLALTRG